MLINSVKKHPEEKKKRKKIQKGNGLHFHLPDHESFQPKQVNMMNLAFDLFDDSRNTFFFLFVMSNKLSLCVWNRTLDAYSKKAGLDVSVHATS